MGNKKKVVMGVRNGSFEEWDRTGGGNDIPSEWVITKSGKVPLSYQSSGSVSDGNYSLRFHGKYPYQLMPHTSFSWQQSNIAMDLGSSDFRWLLFDITRSTTTQSNQRIEVLLSSEGSNLAYGSIRDLSALNSVSRTFAVYVEILPGFNSNIRTNVKLLFRYTNDAADPTDMFLYTDNVRFSSNKPSGAIDINY